MNHPKSSHSRLPAICAAAGLLGALAGCNIIPPPQQDATRYFVLSDAAPGGAPAGLAPAAAGGLRIGLRPVALASYLDHRTMVVRTGASEVRFEDFRRWAEPLDAGIARVLRTALLSSPDVAQVFVEPFPLDQERDFDVSIKVVRCGGAETSMGRYAASLEATIEITAPGAAPRVVSRRVFVAPDEPWDGDDFGRLAALLTKDVAALGRDVLAGIPPRG
ncbi:MAG TPA: PqiC family protein [Opitutaceae bacterium]|nr:PqiC family protein [Opitutaceae bacterium]